MQEPRRLFEGTIDALDELHENDFVNASVPVRIFCGAVLAIALLSAAIADDASPWQHDKHSSMRLLAGSRTGSAILGGIELKLAQGWKTYWRTPGDSGVPPRFDFSRSDNVKAITVLWPAPRAFDDGAGGLSLGYIKDIILPLRITAKSADRPVRVRASISYAVCEKLCVPVEAEAELDFENVASVQDSALLEALNAVPTPARVGDANAIAIRDIRRDGSRVQVDVASAPDDATSLFVEGPTPDWALPVPKQSAMLPDNTRRFTFDLEGLPPGASAEGANLKFTLVGRSAAYEVSAVLD